MKASVNGTELELPDGSTLAQLLQHVDVPSQGIAVAKNDRVIRRAAFANEPIAEGDRIEIIKAVAGG
jgi:sulfur carrier protein